MVDGLGEAWGWLGDARGSGARATQRRGAAPWSSRAATATSPSHVGGTVRAAASWQATSTAAATAGWTARPATTNVVPLVLYGGCQSCGRRWGTRFHTLNQRLFTSFIHFDLFAYSLTIEEIALVLQYLADLVDPDLTDSRTCWMEGISLQVATWRSGCECELAGVFCIFF